MSISLADITIPTPAAYDSSDPAKQRENLCYVALQILAAAKSAEEPISINVDALQSAVEDLTFSGERIEIPALGIMLQKLGKTIAIQT